MNEVVYYHCYHKHRCIGRQMVSFYSDDIKKSFYGLSLLRKIWIFGLRGACEIEYCTVPVECKRYT
eukprot:scaffold157_cov80-Skeletonema_dohrnii-CCMP3373.AAC.3